MSKQAVWGPIACFLALTVLISSVFWMLIIFSGHVAGGGGHYVEALMWSPAAAAFLTVYLLRLNPASLGLRWSAGRYAWMGYLIPLAYAAIAYAAVWALGLGGFPNPAAITALSTKLGWTLTSPVLFVPIYFVFIGSIGMISSVAHALGEEIGWRGFLAPRMTERLGFTGGAFVTGLIWTAWHTPLILGADYHGGAQWWVALPCFTVLVVGVSFVLTWLRLRSGSVWPCAILHASHNLFIQAFFTPLTTSRGAVTAYAIDEFGLAVPIIVVLFAIGFWRLRGRLGGALASQPGSPARV